MNLDEYRDEFEYLIADEPPQIHLFDKSLAKAMRESNAAKAAKKDVSPAAKCRRRAGSSAEHAAGGRGPSGNTHARDGPPSRALTFLANRVSPSAAAASGSGSRRGPR